MKKRFTYSVLFLLFLQLGSLHAQLLDSLTLDSIPAITSLEEAMKNPEAVIKLELRREKLKSFPPEILKMKNLQYLDLAKNSISEIPAEIATLEKLQYLSLSKNDLESIPASIGDLSNLIYLNINQNELSALPAQLGKLTKLRNLDLWSNNIESFPEELKYMKSLRVMDLRVILIPDEEQSRLQSLLPYVKIYFSPYCKCAQ